MDTHRLVVTALVLAGSAAGCTATTGPATPAPACSATVREDVLPAWARAGFSDPSPSGVPYVLGERGMIAGVLFGHPLTAPPPGAGRADKIRWAADPAVTGPGDLAIDARLDGSAEVVHRVVPGGPGPSIINLPRPGCWHLTLTWGDRSDTLDLRYAAAASVESR